MIKRTNNNNNNYFKFNKLSKIVIILVMFYIIPSSVVTLSNNVVYGASITTTTQSGANGASVKDHFYNCEKHGITLHCDAAPNFVPSYSLRPTFSTLYPVTNQHPTFVDSNQSKALELHDYKREFVVFPNSSAFNPSQFSVSFWIKQISDTSPHGQVISHVNKKQTAGWFFDVTTKSTTENSSSSSQAAKKTPTQTLRFAIFNDQNDMIKSKDIPISTSAYAHIVGTFDGSVGKVYKDGVLVDTFQFNGNYNPDPEVPLKVGSAAYCSSCERWSGDIDETRFYNRALAQDEVKKISASDSSNGGDSNGLIGFWKFNGDLNDVSGNKNNGRLFTPLTSMVFTPDGRLLFTEKNTGMIRIMMQNHTVLDKPFATVPDVYVNWEQGLLGITLDPDFANNHFVYTYYTTIDNNTNTPFNRVVRFTDNNNTATNMLVLLDNIPASKGFHSGGALAFGPDEKLYITVGDATEHEFAQDPSTLVGKVLRINKDGTIPKDNPFPNSPVYTLGHRNSFGIAFDKTNSFGVVTENGDEFYDELNLIQKGGNYGFPLYQPPNIAPELSNSSGIIKPLRSYWQTVAPTQAIYYTGDKFPILKDKFLFGTFTGDIFAVQINNGKDGRKQMVEDEEHIAINQYPFEAVIGLAQSPNGDIYYGCYNIYKLDSLNSLTKKQDSFPIQISSPKDVVVNGLEGSDVKDYVSIDLQRNMSTSNTSTQQPVLNIKIPKGIMNTISEIRSSGINETSRLKETQPLNFSLDSSSSAPGYNVITTRLAQNTPSIELLINGSTSAATGSITPPVTTTTTTTNASTTNVKSTASTAAKASSPADLVDNFETGTYTLAEGQISPNKQWQNVYNGDGGSSGVKKDPNDKNVFFMYPKISKTSNETHANLVKTTKTFSNFDMNMDVKTEKQLRENSPPNPWEAAWVFFRYTDQFHYYWFTIKSTGVELGKKDCDTCKSPYEGQIFLHDSDKPVLKVGDWSNWNVRAQGNHISIKVNGTDVLSFTDNGMSKKLASGSIGLYDEDASVSFDNVNVKAIKLQK
jgi:glucose/arabinose dehydrogenase